MAAPPHAVLRRSQPFKTGTGQQVMCLGLVYFVYLVGCLVWFGLCFITSTAEIYPVREDYHDVKDGANC